MLYETIQNERGEIPVSKACSLLAVNRRAYLQWKAKPEVTPQPETELENEIRKITGKFLRYGYRPVYHALKRKEIKVGKKKVLKTMRKLGLLCKKRVFRIATTDSNHGLRTHPNLLQDLEITRLNQAWGADITYIRFADYSTAYLAVILDLYSRKCIGWQLSKSIDAQLCIDALEKAFKEREGIDLAGLIHHSDQGVQYAATRYTTLLEERGILISMSRKGNPYDNAKTERFIETVKYEEVYMKEYNTFDEATENIDKFIGELYNEERLNSAIGYRKRSKVFCFGRTESSTKPGLCSV